MSSDSDTESVSLAADPLEGWWEEVYSVNAHLERFKEMHIARFDVEIAAQEARYQVAKDEFEAGKCLDDWLVILEEGIADRLRNEKQEFITGHKARVVKEYHRLMNSRLAVEQAASIVGATSIVGAASSTSTEASITEPLNAAVQTHVEYSSIPDSNSIMDALT